MAITSVKEKPVEGGEDEDTSRNYRRQFWVVSNLAAENPLLVRAAVGISRNDSHPYDPNVLAQSIVERQMEDSQYIWEVTVTYGTLTMGSRSSLAARSDPTQRDPNPTLRPSRISVRTTRFTRPITTDLNGDAVANTAGDAYDPPPEKDDSRATITITCNLGDYSFIDVFEFVDCINSDDYLGFPEKTLKLSEHTAERQFENNVFFHECTFTFEYRPDGWDLKLLNRGYNEKVDNRLVPIKLKDGTTPSVPQKLTLNGRWQEDPDVADVINTHPIYTTRDFNDLNLP